MNQETVALLVLEVMEGSDHAFSKLYRELHPAMRRFIIRRTGNTMVAEDLVQNVWIKVTKRIHKLEDVSLFRSWLYRALRWELLDWQRAQTKLEYRDAEDAGYVFQVEMIDIPKVLRQLEEKERTVVELYYLCDLSVHETALTLSVPEGTVKSRLSKARKVLANLFELPE